MLWLVDPTNVADAAIAGERTCVERISPVEGEGFELSVPLARESLFLACGKLAGEVVRGSVERRRPFSRGTSGSNPPRSAPDGGTLSPR